MNLRWTQPLTEMSTRYLPGGRRLRLTTSPPSVRRLSIRIWEPRRLTTLWASTDCYRDSFSFLPKNITVFWDLTFCSSVDDYQRFGGTSFLHLWGRGVVLTSRRTCLRFSVIKEEACNSCRTFEMNKVARTLRLFTHIWSALISVLIVLLYWKWLPRPGYFSELPSDLLTIQ
jgi:hypothetical protein